MANKKMIFLLSLSILITIAIVAGTTYAYLSVSSEQKKANTIETACFSNSLTGTDNIDLMSYPMSNEKGLQLNPYKFTITNNCSDSNNYQIYLNILEGTSENLLNYINYSLDGTYIKRLSNMNPSELPSKIGLGVDADNISKSYLIETGSLIGSKDFNLYLWIDESAGNDIMGSVFKANVMAYNVQG